MDIIFSCELYLNPTIVPFPNGHVVTMAGANFTIR